ncbi:MAG: FHIPEP family type III secretion protein [Bryobacteraceae bacterium]
MSEMTSLHMCIQAECDKDVDRSEITERIIPALQGHAESLGIPVTITGEFLEGDGCLSIGDTVPRLHRQYANVGTLQSHEVWGYAAQLISREVAEHIWSQWYPYRLECLRDAAFMTLLAGAFREVVTLGYRLTRFRDALVTLSPQSSVAEWHDSLEAVFGTPDSARLRLVVSREIYAQAIDGPEPQVAVKWKEVVDFMADGLFVELGILYPPLQVAIDETLAADQYRCEWNDVLLPARKSIQITEILVNDTVERLALIGHHGAVETENPATRQPASILPVEKQEQLKAQGLTTWDLPGYLILVLAATVREGPGAFVNVPFTEYSLLTLERSHPELVAASEARFSKTKLTRILRGIATGGVPVNDLPTILTALVMIQQVIKVDKSPAPILDSLTGVFASAVASRIEDLSIDDYVEHIRRSLTRSIGSKFSRNTGTLVVYLLDTEFERKIATAVNVNREIRRELIEAIRAETSHLPQTAQMPLLLVSVDSRSRVQEALFPEYRRMSVLSYGDLDAEMNIQPVARISPHPARK